MSWNHFWPWPDRPPDRDEIADHVTALIELLARTRQRTGAQGTQTPPTPDTTPEPSAEVRAEIDAHVRAIEHGFQPVENAVVAGARLEKVIGLGNFGTVWRAVDVDTGERVAVKVFRLERLTLSQMLVRFRRSIRAMRLLSEERRLAGHRASGSVRHMSRVRRPGHMSDIRPLCVRQPGRVCNTRESRPWIVRDYTQV